MITATGNNLNIVICCNYTVCDNWMAFLCWYSISKNLPDAKVSIFCNRTPMKSRLFSWPKKCNVVFELHKKMSDVEQMDYFIERNPDEPVIFLKPYSLAVRDFEESGFDTQLITARETHPDLCCDAKEDKSCVFVTYLNGWGKFVTSEWIHKLSCPISSENRFGYGNLTANEVRIGKLWSAAALLFQTVSGG